jgi:hypothetical protein
MKQEYTERLGPPDLPKILLTEDIPPELIADIAGHTEGQQDEQKILYTDGKIDFVGNPTAENDVKQGPHLQFGEVVASLSDSVVISRPTSVTFLWLTEGKTERQIRTVSINGQGQFRDKTIATLDILDPSQDRAVEMLDQRPRGDKK